MSGFADVLVGLQYGDEGKARITDNIAYEYDIIVRFNGGPNAGHTVEVDGKRISLHQIPSGIFHLNLLLYIGSGCVINPVKLVQEIKDVEQLGISLQERLHISGQATTILPHHIALDELIGKELGTTGNGIGPAYADQALRSNGVKIKNLRMSDFLEDTSAAIKVLIDNYEDVIPQRGGSRKTIEQQAGEWIAAMETLRQYICTDSLWLDELVRGGKNVLFEGAQASMLDVIKGTVPYVTSSHTIAGSAYVGGDLSPNYHRKTIGVAKAIMSRVGNGPFVSEFGGAVSERYCAEDGGKKNSRAVEMQQYLVDELLDSGDFFKIGIALRMLGNEYGATTKRPRRIGMHDLVLLAQNCRINGVTELYINKMDCLFDFCRTSLSGIPVVTAYELDGRQISHIPNSTLAHRRTKPVIEYLPTIKQHLCTIKTYEELPSEAKVLLKKIEQNVGCTVNGIGVGPNREQFIQR